MRAREKLLGWLDAERDRQVEFLRAFTRIDTCNPPGDTTEAADFFRRFLDAEGLAHRTESPQASMPNLISSFTGAKPGRHLILNGHLDVFPIGDRSVWKGDPLSGEIVDGRVYGRGTVDMKCGTTALLFVHSYLHRLKDDLPGKVTLTVVSDEETGGKWGADWLVNNCADEVLGDCVLNTEPSGLQTVRFGEKSMLWVRFRVNVPGGHSAYPHTSPSANKIAASLIKELEAIEKMEPDDPEVVRKTLMRADVRTAADRSLGLGAADVVRRVSVNIGVMQGGVKVNMLPAECVLDVDFRLPVGITRKAVLDAIAAIVVRYPAISFEELLEGNPEANWCDPTHEMVGHLTRNAASVLGYEPKPIVSLGGTDTRFWRMKGVPAYVYGCSPAGMGGVDEAVSIDEFRLILRTHALAAFDYLMAGA